MANQASPNQGNQASPNQNNQASPNQANPNPNIERWYFTKEQLGNTPSIKCGFDPHKELSYRQQAANFIQDMGQRLKVSQLCINTAIVYMHRFYVFHSFTNFAWHQMASAALFLAAKVEEQPRKLEYVIRVANICRNSKDTQVDLNSERYINQSQDLVFNENVLLQTLGFDVAIDHPHTHVVRCCQMVRASKDLAQTSYFMASNSLHLTTMCIQYKPTVVACFCILVACKWSNWEIPLSNEGKQWFKYVDETVSAELLQQLTNEFLVIFEACPSRLKEKIMAIAENVSHRAVPQDKSLFDTEPRKVNREQGREQHQHRSSSSRPSTEAPATSQPSTSQASTSQPSTSQPSTGQPSTNQPSTSQQQQQSQQQPQRDPQRERDHRGGHRSDRPPHHVHNQKMPPMPGASQPKASSHGGGGGSNHHRPPVDPKQMKQPRPVPAGYQPQGSRVEPRDILRDAAISPFGIANRDGASSSSSRDGQKRDSGSSSGGFPEPPRSTYAPDRPRSDAKHRPDASKPPPPHPHATKHESSRSRHESHSSKQSSSSHPNKPSSSSSQQPKTKSPFTIAPPSENKSASRHATHIKPYNGGSYSKTAVEFSELKTPVKEDSAVATPAFIKRPSLFSPDQSPQRREPSPKKEVAAVTAPDLLSPLKSPVAAACGSRSRNASTSSEPELRPVMKKIDQVEGFENLMRDTTIGMDKVAAPAHAQQIPDVITPVVDLQTETVGETPDVVPLVEAAPPAPAPKPIVNGLETNPAVISNWLKEAANAGSHLPVVAELGTGETKSSSSGSHHHKSKKKNKDKHKHKDKSRDDRDKKKKHKEKDRDRHRDRSSAHAHSEPAATAPPEPIKIKIQKDKIVNEATPPAPTAVVPSAPSTLALKLKIPKNKINSDNASEKSQGSAPAPQPAAPTLGIKLKIPKEKLSFCPNLDGGSSSSGKKRDRDRSSPPEGAPPHKYSKSNKDHKTNGSSRHSSSSSSSTSGSKVAHMGGGETSTHRLAESKYTHKSSTS